MSQTEAIMTHLIHSHVYREHRDNVFRAREYVHHLDPPHGFIF